MLLLIIGTHEAHANNCYLVVITYRNSLCA